ncbi:MAG: 3'-5' exonuclease [Bacteroidota bacterium]|nr:3'-5' exonuclease [Bacteroidota bacterium]MDX5505460.1 3'-5' exonuclease [Bacteroidota bacterium]
MENIDLSKVLFLDIETVPGAPDYQSLSPEFQVLWDEKTAWQRQEGETPEEFYPKRAGILAEFGKIICISVAYFSAPRQLRVKSFFGEDEKDILTRFSTLLNQYFNQKDHLLCAHNGKEFDFPYLCRRMLIHRLPLPDILQIQGKKPWEIGHLDTMELWKFGDRKNFTSLKLLAALFGIPTPKEDMDGSMVGPVFWKEKDLERIARYCEKDTITLAQLLLAFRAEPILEESEITIT